MWKILFAVCLMCVVGPAVADDDGDGYRPDHGWFWYEKPPVQKPAASQPVATAPAPAPVPAEAQKPKDDGPQRPVVAVGGGGRAAAPAKHPMNVAWLRKMMPILMDRAIDNPTPDNLAAYFYVQRVYADKAQRYSEEAKKFVDSQPMLDENNRVPLSGYGRNEFLGKTFQSRELALHYLAKNVGGLFVFFDSKCDFCRAQVPIIKMMQATYGFNVKYISMDGKGLPGLTSWVSDNGHAKMLDLKIYPSIVFAVPPKTYLIVSQGMMAKEQLADRILTAATSNKLLPQQMENDVNPWDRGVLTVEDMQDGASDNPDEVVKYIKEKLKEKY